jgi:hypothetical protein
MVVLMFSNLLFCSGADLSRRREREEEDEDLDQLLVPLEALKSMAEQMGNECDSMCRRCILFVLF